MARSLTERSEVNVAAIFFGGSRREGAKRPVAEGDAASAYKENGKIVD